MIPRLFALPDRFPVKMENQTGNYMQTGAFMGYIGIMENKSEPTMIGYIFGGYIGIREETMDIFITGYIWDASLDCIFG